MFGKKNKKVNGRSPWDTVQNTQNIRANTSDNIHMVWDKGQIVDKRQINCTLGSYLGISYCYLIYRNIFLGT